MTYCNKKPFIPGFRIRGLAELAGGVCPANEAALLQIQATARPAAKRAWLWYSPMQPYAKSDIASRIEG
jgi:hypothetical protein